MWTLRLDVDEGKLTSGFYEVISYGCCAERSNHAFYNLVTGKQVFEFTEPFLTLSSFAREDSVNRFIGYEASAAAPVETGMGGAWDSLNIGEITYASRNAVISQLRIRGKPPAQYNWDTEIPTYLGFETSDSVNRTYSNQLSLVTEHSTFDGIKIKIVFDDPKDTLIVAVKDDKLIPVKGDYGWCTIASVK